MLSTTTPSLEAVNLEIEVQQLGLERYPATGVGRLRGNCLSVHRQYESVLPQTALQLAKTLLPQPFAYTVVKHDQNIDAFTFIAVPDFDTADTPCLGEAYTIKRNGAVSFRNANQRGELCHDKWLLVRNRYAGFDVPAAKRYSCRWRLVPGLNRSSATYADYWERHIAPKIK